MSLCLQDPQYMQQALTNALLMDAVVGSLQSSKAIYAASKLAHFDRIKTEGGDDYCCCWLLDLLLPPVLSAWEVIQFALIQFGCAWYTTKNTVNVGHGS